MMTVDYLRRLTARASTIDERLRGDHSPSEAVEDDARIAAGRIAAWRRAGAVDDIDWLARRLAHDGIDEGSALALLSNVEPHRHGPLPEWAKTIRWVAPTLKRGAGSWGDGNGDPLPFEELLWPAVRAADRRLALQLGGTLQRLLAKSARADLRRSLLSNLSRACAPALFSEFRLFRHLARGPLGGLLSPTEAAGSRKIYDAFLTDFRQRWDEFLHEKPVLARMIGTIAGQWLEATTEFIRRLARDLPALSKCLARDVDFGKVVSLQTDLSDPHRGRRMVLVLGFATGQKIVYKPKDIRIDAAWTQLWRWLADHQAPVSQKAPRVLVREGYGWTEFITADPGDPAPAGGTPLFYRHAGGLLAILYALQAKDLHYENVITSGGAPVVVDLETLLHPDLATPFLDRPADAATRAALDQIAGSVLATYYLPIWAFRPDGRVAAIGGIERHPAEQDDNEGFHDINTDAMTFIGAGRAAVSQATTPSPENKSLLRDNGAPITEGFEGMYSFLSAHRAELVAPDGPIARFRGLGVRAVINPTAAYRIVAKRAAQPENLNDGVDWSLCFDVIGRDIPRNPEANDAWRVLAAERRALANFDIPFFSAATDAKWIETGDGERIEDYLAEAPVETVLNRIGNLNEQDLALQLRLIRGALSMARPKRHEPLGDDVPYRLPARTFASENAQTAPDGHFIKAARKLGAAVNHAAIRTKQGAAWIGAVPVDHDHSAITVIGTDLYAGTLGIALFLAALARVANGSGARDLAMAAIASARRIHAPTEYGPRSGHRMGIGGGMGIGSVIYGLVRIASLLSEPTLLEEAARMSLLLTEDRIASDRALGALYGAAGAILGLLALHGATGDAVILERAVLCGRHLLTARIADDGNRGWRPRRGSAALPAGLAYGVAGIALALARLYVVTGEEVFRQAARDAIRYEAHVLVPAPSKRLESDCRGKGAFAECCCQWCRGSTGIGLACLGVLGVLDDAELSREINKAVGAITAQPLAAHDYLCCGNFGRIDFLLTAGRYLGRSDLVESARREAMHLIARSTKRGGFGLETNEEGLYPGFFRGISGIGYELLRLADPATLPSVLLWE